MFYPERKSPGYTPIQKQVKFIFFYTWILAFLNSKHEDKQFWAAGKQAFLEFSLLLNAILICKHRSQKEIKLNTFIIYFNANFIDFIASFVPWEKTCSIADYKEEQHCGNVAVSKHV